MFLLLLALCFVCLFFFRLSTTSTLLSSWTAQAVEAFIPDLNARGCPLLFYSLFFVNYFDSEPVLDEVFSCPKGLHVWLVLPLATLVWWERKRCFFFSFFFSPHCNWEIASKCLSDPLPTV